MTSSTAITNLKKLSPRAFEQVSGIYQTLSHHIPPSYHIGPALASLESFCDLFLILLSDSKDKARIKIAAAHSHEIWFGFYPSKVDEIAVEFIYKRDRGEYGEQVCRWGLVDSSDLAGQNESGLKVLFAPYN